MFFRITLILSLLLSLSIADECLFNKRKDGEIIYGVNDGGCFFCSRAVGSSVPLTGTLLVETCQQMCEADPLCIAYETSQIGSLPVYEHALNGVKINCCLERSTFPKSLLVDSINDDTNCGKDGLCWTRYDKVNPAEQSCEIMPPSDLCVETVEPASFAVDDLQDHIEWIANGCLHDDNKTVELLDQARKDCEANLKQGTGNENSGDGLPGNNPSAADVSSQLMTYIIFVIMPALLV